jgi:DNA-directed RNA polymerase specialized sigma24 family protein
MTDEEFKALSAKILGALRGGLLAELLVILNIMVQRFVAFAGYYLDDHAKQEIAHDALMAIREAYQRGTITDDCAYPYSAGVVRNLVRNKVRSQARTVERLSTLALHIEWRLPLGDDDRVIELAHEIVCESLPPLRAHIARLLAAGMAQSQIATHLKLSRGQVRTHVTHIRTAYRERFDAAVEQARNLLRRHDVE